MSDSSHGPGWWLTSDSRRYPPEFGDGLAIAGIATGFLVVGLLIVGLVVNAAGPSLAGVGW